MTKRESWEAFVKEIDERIKMMDGPSLHAIRPSEADAIVVDVPLMLECVDEVIAQNETYGRAGMLARRIKEAGLAR